MAKPIDYRNSKSERERTRIVPLDEEREPARVRAAVPPEFDALLAKTTDHAGAQAIVAALGRNDVEVHLNHGGELAMREVSLFIRKDDWQKASLIAAEIFVRRKKLKSYPRTQQPDPLTTDGLNRAYMPFIWM